MDRVLGSLERLLASIEGVAKRLADRYAGWQEHLATAYPKTYELQGVIFVLLALVAGGVLCVLGVLGAVQR